MTCSRCDFSSADLIIRNSLFWICGQWHYEQAEVEAYVQMAQAEFDPDLVTVRMDQIGGTKFTEPPLPVAEIRSAATLAKRMVSLMACALP